MKDTKMYLAGPLFSLGEREFNQRLVESLTEKMASISFIVPQKYASEIYGQKGFAEQMFDYCLKSLDDADIVLCILDGPDVDSGTCIEMGYAYARGKPVVGIRTDFRSSEDRGMNLMVSKVCRELIWLPSSRITEKELIEEVVVVLGRVLEMQ